jgi:hypothetical protein
MSLPCLTSAGPRTSALQGRAGASAGAVPHQAVRAQHTLERAVHAGVGGRGRGEVVRGRWTLRCEEEAMSTAEPLGEKRWPTTGVDLETVGVASLPP